MTTPIRLLLSDVDGTLITSDKVITSRTVDAVQRLRDAGVLFAIASARPAQGLAMFAEPLGLTTPLAALNGGLIVDTDLTVLRREVIDEDLVGPIIDALHDKELSVWLYQGMDWFVLDELGPHVQRESLSCQFAPTPLTSFRDLGDGDGVTKIVGVGDDPVAHRDAEATLRDRFGSQVTASPSNTSYLDVTPPRASKGYVVRFLADRYDIDPLTIATIGDMHNDVSMFAASGRSIAMGNAVPAVQRSANHVTTSNNDEGFANAVTNFVLRE